MLTHLLFSNYVIVNDIFFGNSRAHLTLLSDLSVIYSTYLCSRLVVLQHFINLVLLWFL